MLRLTDFGWFPVPFKELGTAVLTDKGLRVLLDEKEAEKRARIQAGTAQADNIVASSKESETESPDERAGLVAEYRKLLQRGELSQQDGERLLKVASALGRTPDDVEADAELIAEIAEAEREAAELPRLAEVLRLAVDRREVERQAIEVAERELQERRDHIDDEVDRAREDVERAEGSARWLAECRRCWSDIFGDQGVTDDQ